MASRHLSRSIAMQSLYEWDFYGKNPDALDSIVKRNIEDFGPGLEDKDFAVDLAKGVQKHI
ncbi:MAG: transcription antitermination factor NusB, partial [Patescibacteria group bacterium]